MLVGMVSGTERMLISTDFTAMCVVMPVMTMVGSLTAPFASHPGTCSTSNVMFAVSAFMGLVKNILIAEFSASGAA